VRRANRNLILIVGERSYVGTRKKRCCRVGIGKLLRVAYHDLFDLFDGSVTQNLRAQPAGNLSGCPAIRLELPRSLGNRDPTRFRRIISRYRPAATNIAPLAISDPGRSRPVLATPRLSRNECPTSPMQSVADPIAPALYLILSGRRIINTFVESNANMLATAAFARNLS